ncbi:MAG: aminotransferase class IV [Verrucomicrobiae bacterium]|nr:aminotransferase class IV [Verrucomicrobiae bacterium]
MPSQGNSAGVMPMDVYLNGEFVEESRAAIAPTDRGFQFGDGLFETMRVSGGKILQWEAHRERMQAGMAFLGMPPLPEMARTAEVILELQQRNGVVDGIARIVLTRGRSEFGLSPSAVQDPTWLITLRSHVFPRTDDMQGIRAVVTRIPIYPPLVGFKTLNYLPGILARRCAETAGVEEGFLVDAAHHVCEASSGNIFAVARDRLITPGPGQALPGVTRRVILQIAERGGWETVEGSLSRETLRDAEEIFLTSSIAGIRPVIGLDGNEVGTGKIGPVTRQLAREYQHFVEQGGF